MVIKFSQNVLNQPLSNSTEFDERSTPHDVAICMSEIGKETMGGNMRLGERSTIFVEEEDSVRKVLFGGVDRVEERHRHWYEVNPKKVNGIHAAGLKFVGKDTTDTRLEIAKLPQLEHPYHVGCQYHPEFKSWPLAPSPLFLCLIMASCGVLEGFLENKQQGEEKKD